MPDYAKRRITMVDTQVRPNDVTRYPVIAAMLQVPRERFVPESRREIAYAGENIDLGHGRVLLEPRSLAKLIDALAVDRDDLVMDLGCCYGYSTAVLASIAQAVVAVEQDSAMAEKAERLLTEQGIDNVVVVRAALTDGAPAQGPYDAILINGAIEQLPDAIADQLREGGRIAALWHDEGRGAGLGVARLGYKLDGRINWRYAFNAYAPVLPGMGRTREFTL